jgi:hypothetical protein
LNSSQFVSKLRKLDERSWKIRICLKMCFPFRKCSCLSCQVMENGGQS